LRRVELAGRVVWWDLDSGERVRRVDVGSPVLCLGAAEGFVAVGMMSGEVAIFTAKGNEVRRRYFIQ
jgi:hypothetical protein